MAKRRSSDDAQATQEQGVEIESGEELDLYQTEVSRYLSTVERGLEEAFQRYGFSLFHSLPGSKQVELSEKLGLLRHDAVDLYNLGGLALERQDYEGAAKLYQKALDLDGTQADAAYNLALCMERLERKSEAENAWSRFLEHTQSDDDRRDVEAHLAELQA